MTSCLIRLERVCLEMSFFYISSHICTLVLIQTGTLGSTLKMVQKSILNLMFTNKILLRTFIERTRLQFHKPNFPTLYMIFVIKYFAVLVKDKMSIIFSCSAIITNGLCAGMF